MTSCKSVSQTAMEKCVIVLSALFIMKFVLGKGIRTDSLFGKTRIVYIAAVDIEWDYAPFGNLVNDDPRADDFIRQGPNRIGSKYDKAVYREYTDGSFLKEVPRPDWLGYLGPVFRAEVGDTILIVFANLAFKCNRPLSVHPHGVFYLKNAEGALYGDQTSGKDKLDDGVPPGKIFTYKWEVRDTFAPTDADENCLLWPYHSHRMSAKDIDTGLIGMFFTCKPGTLDTNGQRRDVDREFVIYQDVINEQNSWCIDSNLEKCGDPRECSRLLAQKEPAFNRSNTFHHINGYLYGNLPGLKVNAGEKVVLHFFALNAGIQSAHINGQVLLSNNNRLDAINFYPGTSRSATWIPENPGVWLLISRVSDWYMDGMQAFVTVHQRRNIGSDFLSYLNSYYDLYENRLNLSFLSEEKQLKRYFIAAEKIIWDYGPSGQDLFNGGSLTRNGSQSANFFTRSSNRIGGRYVKALYIEYTDETFTERKHRTKDEIHLGMLGPPITAEVGDHLQIVFLNKADRDYSVYVHGIPLIKEEEGFVMKDPSRNENTGKFAKPGEKIVYNIKVTEGASPTEDDPPCLTYMYHSAVDAVKDLYTGLIGPLVICKKGKSFDWSSRDLVSEPQKYDVTIKSYDEQLESNARQLSAAMAAGYIFPFVHSPSETQTGYWINNNPPISRVFYLMFTTMDENQSWYIDENIQRFALDPSSVVKENPEFFVSNTMFGINGLTNANLPALDMCVGDHVTWHLFGFGSFLDTHGVNFHGQTLEINGNRVEGKVVNPGTGVTLHAVPDSVGRWSVVCRSNAHFNNGMVALYNVHSCGARRSERRRYKHVRRYYIAAEEVIWNYAPILTDLVTGLPLTNSSLPGYLFIRGGPNFIGSSYKKAIYRQYTDGSFTERLTRGPEEEHLGIMGPFIRAEVGDIVEVVFKNMASRPFSVHPQGMFYNKANEGAEYQDGSRFKGDNAVPPGEIYAYKWAVPERSGPGKNDPNCISWIYHSSVDSTADIYSGLFGPLVICRAGILDRYGRRKDKVDREFAILFMGSDENESHYFRENLAKFAPNRTDISAPDFFFSNIMFSVNGLIYGNLRGLTMMEGETIAWHVLGLGTYLDFHPIHFHGQTFIHRTNNPRRDDVIEVFPSTSQTVEMFTDNPGTWLVHCHFSIHVVSGMEAVYTILPRNSNADKNGDA